MKKILVTVIILALIIAGGAYFVIQRRTARAENSSQSSAVQKEQNYYTVQNGSLLKTISANGNILPVKEKDLVFLTNGRVKEVKMTEGDRVKSGQLLATLENTSEELSLLKAKNNYETAQINNSKAAQSERKLEYQIAERNYKDTFLYAPFDGLVTAVGIEPKDQASASKAAAHLIDDSSYTISVNIDEVDISQIELGQRVRVTLEAYPEMELNGQIVSIGLTAQNQGGVVVVPVEIKITQVPAAIKSGLSASVEIIVGQAKDVPLVPVTALVQRPDGMYVMKKVEGKAKAQKVVTGVSNDLMVAVTEGLQAGDEIIVNNFEMIQQIRDNLQQRNPLARQMNPLSGQQTTTGARR